MMRQIETRLYIDKLQFVCFGKFQEKGKIWQKISTKNQVFVEKLNYENYDFFYKTCTKQNIGFF